MKTKPFIVSLPIILFLVWIDESIRAEVVDSSAYGFTVRGMITVHADSQTVYKHLVKDVSKWWDPDHTFSGQSKNLSIDARANGCFCEKLDNGGSVRHMTVVYAKPGKFLRLLGGLGPLQGMGVSGTLTFLLYASQTGTNIEMTYAVGGYCPGGLEEWASSVNQVLMVQLNRLKHFIDTGKP